MKHLQLRPRIGQWQQCYVSLPPPINGNAHAGLNQRTLVKIAPSKGMPQKTKDHIVVPNTVEKTNLHPSNSSPSISFPTLACYKENTKKKMKEKKIQNCNSLIPCHYIFSILSILSLASSIDLNHRLPSVVQSSFFRCTRMPENRRLERKKHELRMLITYLSRPMPL